MGCGGEAAGYEPEVEEYERRDGVEPREQNDDQSYEALFVYD